MGQHDQQAAASSSLAPLPSVTEVLERDEHRRINRLAGSFLLLIPIVALSLWIFDGHPVTTRLFGALLAASFVVTGLFYDRTRRGRFSVAGLAVTLVFEGIVILGATAYFGPFSPVAIVAVVVTVFASFGAYPAIGLAFYAVSAAGRLVLVGPIIAGVFADPGIITAGALPVSQQICGELLVQAILLISLIAGRGATKTTNAKVNWLIDSVKAAAKREVEIASRIQMTILPRNFEVPGFVIAARMTPATEVGGDYYDVRLSADGDGCWIGIGDVSGHGLTAGLIMMMVQTAVAAQTLDDSHGPADIVERVNRVIHDNVKDRLHTGDFVTFSLLRLRRDGSFVIAGRHEPVIIHRAATGACEVVDPEGLWLGLQPSIASATKPLALQLAAGDTLILHTDGVTEGANADGERYGLERLTDAVTRHAALGVGELRDTLEREAMAFAAEMKDDVTLLVARYGG